MAEVNFTFFLEKDEEKGFIVRCLELKGVYGQGETEEEAISDILNALDIAINYYNENKRQIPYRKYIQVKKNVQTTSTTT